MKKLVALSLIVLASVSMLNAGSARFILEHQAADKQVFNDIKNVFSTLEKGPSFLNAKKVFSLLEKKNGKSEIKGEVLIPSHKLALISPEKTLPHDGSALFKGQKNSAQVKLRGRKEKISTAYSLQRGVALSFTAAHSGLHIVNFTATADMANLYITKLQEKRKWGYVANAKYLKSLGKGNYAKSFQLEKGIEYIFAINGDDEWIFHKARIITIK